MRKTVSEKQGADPDFFEVDLSGPTGRSAPGSARAPSSRRRKKPFPAGIFIMLFLVESCLAAGAVLAYFFHTGKSKINEIESFTADYLVPLAEALGSVAELNYRSRNYSRLRTLFHEKIEQRIVDEAFFVLKSGKIIAHSKPEIEKNIKGNIAGDEFAYNLDLIMKPVNQKSREALFTDYNIIARPPPFDRVLRMILKEYLYQKIDSTGWMVSRAVYRGNKPVGAVCLIVSKGRIYTFLTGHMDTCLRMLIAGLGVSFFISLLVALAVTIRYRSIQKTAVESTAKAMMAGGGAGEDFYDVKLKAAGGAGGEDEPIVAEILMPAGEHQTPGAARSEGTGAHEKNAVHSAASGGSAFQAGREIKDAIPTGEGR